MPTRFELLADAVAAIRREAQEAYEAATRPAAAKRDKARAPWDEARDVVKTLAETQWNKKSDAAHRAYRARVNDGELKPVAYRSYLKIDSEARREHLAIVAEADEIAAPSLAEIQREYEAATRDAYDTWLTAMTVARQIEAGQRPLPTR